MRFSLLATSLALLLITGLGAAWPVARADGDHERARRALERGEVLPLFVILERLEPQIGRDVIETEFERDDGRWIYEITYIDRDGRRVELDVDASDATIIAKKRRR